MLPPAMAFGEPAATARGEIVGIQYLRGLAAAAVVFDHASGTLSQGKYLGYSVLGGLLESGQVGVILFFLISGFIIAAVSLKGPGLTPAIDRKTYFSRRFARVVPVMWVAILAYMLLQGIGRGWGDVGAYLRAFFLVPYGAVKPQTIWTLRQELIFYIVFALSMLGPRPLRWLMVAWVVSPLVMWLPRGLFAPGSVPFELLRILFHPVAFAFGAGMLFAVLWFRRTHALVLKSPVEPFLLLTLTFCLPLGVTFASVLWLGYPPSVFVLALCCAPVLFLGIHVQCRPGLGERIGRMLGNASYSIYLFHVHALSIGIALWVKLAPSTPGVVIALGAALLAIAAGVVLHHLVEKPVVRVARRLLDPRPAPAETVPAASVSAGPAPAQPGH